MRRLALGALVLCLLASPAEAATVDAGELRARAGDEHWSLSFADRAGRRVLSEAPGTGSGPTGRLGLRTNAGWFHATRVIRSERRYGVLSATLATNDPGGRRLHVELDPIARGVISLRANASGRGVAATGIAFRARRGERYLGFGERSNAVDQRGNDVQNYVAEGPFEADELGLVPAFVPPWGLNPRPDTSYFPMPWLLSTAGYGVLLENSETSLFRLGTRSRGVWSTEVESSELRLLVLAGPRPAQVLRRLTGLIGRQPAPPAPFVFGPWYQPTGDDEEAVLARLQREDVPLSLAQTYTHYLPCADQVGREDAERERVRRFHDAGLAVTTYFNPMICTSHPAYAEAAASGALATNAAGEPYTYRYSTLESFDVAQFDFTARAGRRLYGRLLDQATFEGYDGWMEDFGEYTPLDARFADGSNGSRMHNLYPTSYHCAVHDSDPVAARYVRSGWTGTARCAPVVWGGDPSVDWGFDGLRSALTNGLTMGLSGVSRWGSDIGGFFGLFENQLTPELLVRWIQLGAVSGVMRTQANGIHVPDTERPQIWDPDVQPHWRRWAKLRTQLWPYIAAADAAYRRTGLPLMRHLALTYPGDARAGGVEDAFMFGPDLLAAPVLRPDARTRSLYLPRGRWVDLWRSARYRSRVGSLALGRPRLLRGGRRVSVPAPLDELPLFARAGTLLPLLPADVDTLAEYGERVPPVSLRERRGRRVLLAFPRGRSTARQPDGRSLRSIESPAGWRLSLASGRPRRWEIQASLRTLSRPFRPCRVSVPGAGRLRGWRYERRSGVLRAGVSGQRAELVVRPCG